MTQPPFWSRSMLCCVLISGERLPDQSIRVVSARSQHLVFKWNFWCFDLSMRLLVMTLHGSVSITSFDRLKMFPHPVTVKATALTDVGLGALSTCQLVAEVHFPTWALHLVGLSLVEVRISLSLSPGIKVTLVFLNKLFFSQCIINLSAVCLADVYCMVGRDTSSLSDPPSPASLWGFVIRTWPRLGLCLVPLLDTHCLTT